MPTYPPRKSREQPTDRRTGRCPACGPGSPGDPIDGCRLCDGSGVLTYNPAFSAKEDATLRSLTESGRPWPFIATSLSRPESVVRSRASVLRIENPRPDPEETYVSVRPCMVKP